MNIRISAKESGHTVKTFYYFEWASSRSKGGNRNFHIHQTKDPLQKNHNKKALMKLETKIAMMLDKQAINSGHIPKHKIKSNFLDSFIDTHLVCQQA